MNTILDQILALKRAEVAQLRSQQSYKDFEQGEYFQSPTRSIRKKIKDSEFGIIAEIKRKSPSAGVLLASPNLPELARMYEEGGAIAISCLTDTPYFGGRREDLSDLRKSCALPLLRKDFILDEIQLFEAKAYGADAVLLIAEALDEALALHLTIVAQQLGLEVLMEFHSQRFLAHNNDQVDIIGVNNRDLHLQQSDLETSFRLAPFLPTDIPCISESGIRSASELSKLRDYGYRGALIGESILRGKNPMETLRSLQIPGHVY
jgi:indole-3-glycerol phosphate synthase